jgi:hypothetical protein
MTIHYKTNLPVPINRVKTLESPYRRNLFYLASAILVLFGVATLISVVGV